MATPYQFCPVCATALVEQFRIERERPTCPACGFVHFPDPKVAVIALVLHEGKVLLAQRAMDPARGHWALPGGYMDADEMPAAALRREILEEVGLEVQVGDLLGIYPMADGEGEQVGIVLAFRARPVAAVEIAEVGHDVQAAGWFAPREVPAELAFASTRHLIEMWQAVAAGHGNDTRIDETPGAGRQQ